MVTYASYQSVTYKVTTSPQPPLTLTPTTMAKPGIVHVAAKTPCPVGGEGVGIAVLATGTATIGDRNVVADSRGYWQADIDFSPYAAQLRSGTIYFDAICHNPTNGEDTNAPWLHYAGGRVAFSSPNAPRRTYIAMGDSYSSGEGNPPFDSDSDRPGDACHRSAEAWPRVLSRLNTSNLHLIAHIACSGATADALTTTFNSERPQLAQLAAAPHADVITVTLGGNDLHFSTVIRDCYVSQCDRDLTILQAQSSLLSPTGLRATLIKAFQQIRSASPGSRVVLVGYPNIFPTTQQAAKGCGWLSSSERAALVALASDLNAVSAEAASAADVEFVSTLHVLAGHEECTAQSWMVPIGLGTGAQIQQNGHPMALGQQAIAQAVNSYLQK
jgi:lysophospholipase L1-like esterase